MVLNHLNQLGWNSKWLNPSTPLTASCARHLCYQKNCLSPANMFDHDVPTRKNDQNPNSQSNQTSNYIHPRKPTCLLKKVPVPQKSSLPTTILQGNMIVLDPETQYMSYPTTIFQAESVLEAEGRFVSGDMIKQFQSLQPRLFGQIM